MLGLLFSDMSISHVFEKKMEIKSSIPEQQIVSSWAVCWVCLKYDALICEMGLISYLYEVEVNFTCKELRNVICVQ